MAEPEELPDLSDLGEDPSVSESSQDRSTSLLKRVAALPGVRLLSPKFRIPLGAALGVILVLACVQFLTRQEGPEPGELIAMGLELLEDRDNIDARRQAREIALSIKRLNSDYYDSDFPGAPEYILGIAMFRDAQALDEMERDQQSALAADFLREAENRALNTSYRPEWAYALGTCLHYIGKATEARPLLEEAVESYEPGRSSASLRLVDIYLDLKTPPELNSAIDLSTRVLELNQLNRVDLDRLYLQRAQVFLALGRNADAEEALTHISKATAGNNGTLVFRAQTLLADGKYHEALEILEPVANQVGLERTFSRQASFLMGVCAEQLSRIDPEINYDRAISYYERVAERFEKSHEGLAANLRVAELLQNAGFDEEALDAYKRALREVQRPEDFRNRWLSMEDFRKGILRGWNNWVENGKFQEAIDLSKSMIPLVPEVQAYELEARANQRWAEQLEEELKQAPNREWKRRSKELRERWRLSGTAFETLANVLRTSEKYPDALRTSGEHFRKGHDFENALRQSTRFINLQPKKRLPLAIVRRGELLMDLDLLDEALDSFKRVIANYPTDPAAFEAQYVIGQCYLERNELDEAEQAWRQILTSESLTPAAKEWRLALFSLGRLMYHTAEMLIVRAGSPQKTAEEDPQKSASAAFTRWEEAIRLLEEFLNRYPNASDSVEARYLLAKSLQQSAELPRRKLTNAETDNARLELKRAMNELLKQAQKELTALRLQLMQRQESDRLDNLGQRILRNCYFEIAHTFYALERYEEAIVSYNGAANRYPEDPQVLLSYVQMANCYGRLEKNTDARSMLLQAKLILNQMPDEVFQSNATNMTRQEWERWLAWADRLQQLGDVDRGANP